MRVALACLLVVGAAILTVAGLLVLDADAKGGLAAVVLPAVAAVAGAALLLPRAPGAD
jgi:hypothetical protein